MTPASLLLSFQLLANQTIPNGLPNSVEDNWIKIAESKLEDLGKIYNATAKRIDGYDEWKNLYTWPWQDELFGYMSLRTLQEQENCDYIALNFVELIFNSREYCFSQAKRKLKKIDDEELQTINKILLENRSNLDRLVAHCPRETKNLDSNCSKDISEHLNINENLKELLEKLLASVDYDQEELYEIPAQCAEENDIQLRQFIPGTIDLYKECIENVTLEEDIPSQFSGSIEELESTHESLEKTLNATMKIIESYDNLKGNYIEIREDELLTYYHDQPEELQNMCNHIIEPLYNETLEAKNSCFEEAQKKMDNIKDGRAKEIRENILESSLEFNRLIARCSHEMKNLDSSQCDITEDISKHWKETRDLMRKLKELQDTVNYDQNDLYTDPGLCARNIDANLRKNELPEVFEEFKACIRNSH